MGCELCSSDALGDGRTRCQRCGFDTTLPPDVKRFLISLVGFRPGELLEGRYRIDRILGYGGMSVVYKAHDDVLGEEVAIKVINRGRVGDDNKLITDIRRDIVTTRKLAHPGIVKIYDFHRTETCGFLTMEFIPGKDVASLIAERGKLGESEVCRIALQVAEALGYAHANGVIHCDIKPANLLLAGSDRIKIADFGISRVMQEENSGLTGLVVGTPAYMAPEQIRGERPEPRTDMYALGIVMWHCLMGSPPYLKGDIAYQHVHEPLPPLTGVSPALERIIRRAAGKTVADRFPAMDAMARELTEHLASLSVAGDATVVQAPASGLDATVLQSAPAAAGGAAQTLPPEPAGTVVQTAPPLPGTVVQTPPPGQAGTVVQTPTPVAQATVAQAASPRETGTVAQPPLPKSAPPPVPLPRPQPPGAVPGGGGNVPPSPGGPAGSREQPVPASPPASSHVRAAAVAAAVVLLAGAAARGLFFRSPEPAKPGQPLLASGVGAPPNQSPPPSLATSAPPPRRPSPGALPPAPPSAATVGVRAAAVGAGVAASAVGAPAAPLAGGGAERPPVAPAANIATPAPPPGGATPPTVAASPATSIVPPPAPVAVAPRVEPPPPAAPPRPAAPEPEARPVPAAAAAAPAAAPIAAVAPVAPAAAPIRAQPAAVPEQVKPPEPVAARPLDLTPIQITALPRGRWCDVMVRAVGTGLPMPSARSEGERRLTGERSAELDAYRRIAENVKGIQVSGGSTISDFVTTDASYKTKVDAVVRGARRTAAQKNFDGTWSVVLELNLVGMCDVIQAGTP